MQTTTNDWIPFINSRPKLEDGDVVLLMSDASIRNAFVHENLHRTALMVEKNGSYWGWMGTSDVSIVKWKRK
jgi:hypothetical protein